MKRFYLLFTTFILGAALFAEQPYFIKDWIIPENFVWGVGKELDKIPGKTFYQYMGDNKNPYVHFKHIKKSNIDFPPYFTERNLLSWDMTYAEILDAFKDNNDFFTIDYVYPLYEDNYLKGIEFLDIIRIICRNENHINIEIYFPHTPSQEERYASKPSYCYVYYNRKGLKENEIEIPYRERFDILYRKIWDENTLDEKKIIALTYFYSRIYNFVPAKYDCSLLLGNNKKDAADCLKNKFSVNDKQDFLLYVENPNWRNVRYAYNSIVEYRDFSRIMNSNPDKYIIELGAEKKYSITQISQMFFIDAMQEYIGKHGLAPFVDVDRLFVIRLGVGAGYITREESLEYGIPIANKLLKQYNSFYDFTAHFAAFKSYDMLLTSKFITRAQDMMFYYNDAEKYLLLDEIEFDGSEADVPLYFDNAYYNPTGEAKTWSLIQKEKDKLNGAELATIKRILKDYGDVPCLEELIKQIKPAVFENSNSNDRNAFFETNYSGIWNRLPNEEKYAIAFSSNLFELNGQYHLDFENKVQLTDNSASPKELLKESWGIEDYEGLIEMYNSLEEYGHSGAYKNLSELLDKNPDKEPLKIAVDEKLSMLDATRLHFVMETREKLGKHGIEAWDEGREITILRWGISCGYISSEEAMELIEPLIERIRDNYVSYNDYIAHYIMGRQFYALYNGNNEQLGNRAKQAALDAEAYIPFDTLDFFAENADKEHILNLSDCIFIPSSSFTRWEKVMNLYRQRPVTEDSLKQLEQLEKEMPECKDYFFYWHATMLYNLKKYEEVIHFTESNMDYLGSLSKDSSDYGNPIYLYICALNTSFNPKKALSVYNSQPEYLKENVYYYYQYALSNYLMLTLCDTQKEFDDYRETAKNAFIMLKENNYNLDETIENWLKTVQ